MMKKLKYLALIAILVNILSISSMAYAEPKPWIWGWWPSHWDNLDFEPYLENGKYPHNTQWDRKKWNPEDWIAQRKDAFDVVQRFYAADVLRAQYVEDDIPVLEVGPGFYMLGGQDKRRVAEMVDYAYGVTGARPNGMYMLVDWKSHEAIGSYTRYGLQLQ